MHAQHTFESFLRLHTYIPTPTHSPTHTHTHTYTHTYTHLHTHIHTHTYTHTHTHKHPHSYVQFERSNQVQCFTCTHLYLDAHILLWYIFLRTTSTRPRLS